MRFPFLKNKERKVEKTPTTTLKVDVHSHLLPDVDEGAKTIEESIKIISELSDLGFEKLILTPHIMRGFYSNSTTKIKQRFRTLQDAIREKGMSIKLEIAAEYYLDQYLLSDILHNRELLTFQGENEERFLLFETEQVKQPVHLWEAIKRMQKIGLTPVLAHPERYSFLKREYRLVHELYDAGVLLQVNINSFSGYYGTEARELAEYLSVAQMIHFLGSDCHRNEQLEILQKTMKGSNFQSVLRSQSLLNNSLIKEQQQ
jgi:protein-tyrosine phosphatase